MASCLIFHGPGARDAALRKVTEVGHLMAPPYGDAGIRVEDIRDMVAHLIETPRLAGLGCVVAGPIDEAKSANATDALLKNIEEFDGKVVLPILWAHDLGGVPPAIRSRCMEIWSPGTPEPSEDDDKYMGLAWDIVSKVIEGHPVDIPSVIKSLKDNQCMSLVNALSDVLASQIENPVFHEIWNRLRPVTCWTHPKLVEIVLAVMGKSV